MEQVDSLSSPSDSHVDSDVGLCSTALSSLLRVSLPEIGSRSGTVASGSVVERKFCTDSLGLTGTFAKGSSYAGRTIADVGLAKNCDARNKTSLPHSDPKCADSVLAATREAVRIGAVQVVARLLSLIEKHAIAENSVSGVKGYMNLLVAEAIDRRHGEVLRLMLKSGVDPAGTYQNKSHLFRAVTADDVGLVKDLLLFGAGVNAREFNGKTALHAAAATSSRDVIELLLEHGGDLGARDAIQGGTPLHAACTYCNRGAVLLLVERGAELNALNSFCDTPLSKLLGPVTKAEDFHSEARVRLAEELVMMGFVLPKRSSSNPVISDTNTTVSVCFFPPKLENAYRVYERLLKRLMVSLSLKQLCRLRIIQALCHVPLNSSVSSLGLPEIVQNYILSGDRAINTGTLTEGQSQSQFL